MNRTVVFVSNQRRKMKFPIIVLIVTAVPCITPPVVANDRPDGRSGADGPAIQVATRQPRPHWIWPTTDRSISRRASLQTSFAVPSACSSAKLRLAAEFTRCRVLINGRAVVDLDEYGPRLELDLTDGIVLGSNSLRVDCRTIAGPAAVAISLSLSGNDGRRQVIASNDRWQASIDDTAPDASNRAVSFGEVAREFWDDARTARVTAFDDYEQWRQASGAVQGTDPATFATLPGYEVSLVRSAHKDEGSWVSIAFDPEGRLTVAREDRGLLRMTLSSDGKAVRQVETIDDALLEVRGLLYAYGALYANANNSKGMYRLVDSNNDGRFDEKTLLREFPGSVGHGRNDLALGPDGRIYSIHGDAVEYPRSNVVDHTSPFAADRSPGTTLLPQGYLIRTDRNGERWELIARGLRNPFGIDFNEDGEVFTYDADNEYDMGAPWYRPTRINQLVSGGDFGWRRVPSGSWPPYFPDRPEHALPVVDVGKGSPTAVKSGRRSAFPQPYRKALFVLDWAYGRILACHLSPRGAGYSCRVEQFLKGRPLNVTDLDFANDGSMFLVTGGRKTQSALYRVRYVGEAPSLLEPTPQQQARERFSAQTRRLYRQLAALHVGQHSNAIEIAWPHLGHPDPVIRQTAMVAIEHQPVERWKPLALNESDPEVAPAALASLARSGRREVFGAILRRLGTLETSVMSAHAALLTIRAYRLCLTHSEGLDPEVVADSQAHLLDWFDAAVNHEYLTKPPLGSGDGIRRELARLVADLQVSGAIAPLMKMLAVSETQRQRMLALLLLCSQREGWSIRQRGAFFEALRELELTAFSGAGMPGRLQQIRDRATAGLSEAERMVLGDQLKPAQVNSGAPLNVDRPLVRRWKLEELVTRLSVTSQAGDVRRGERLFREVQCIACHRVNGSGGVMGPDLSSVASRFSRRDLLASMVEPSQVVAEKYRATRVLTSDGNVIQGRVVSGGDYRSSVLRLVEDPLRPGEITQIPKSEIEQHQPSQISPMPAGLLDTLQLDEVRDLLAFLGT